MRGAAARLIVVCLGLVLRVRAGSSVGSRTKDYPQLRSENMESVEGADCGCKGGSWRGEFIVK